MPRSISFTRIRIEHVLIDVVTKQISVQYVMLDDTGQYMRSGTAIFTRPLPEGEIPEDMFLIPTTRAQEVLGLVQDIQTAMETKLLV